MNIKVLQSDVKDCGISCLLSIIHYYNSDISKEYLREITKTNNDGVSAYNLIQAANNIGFLSFGVTGEIKNIKTNDLPLIAHCIINNSFGHFIVIYKIKNNYATIMDPSCGIKKIKIIELEKILTKNYIIIKKIKHIPKLTNDIKYKQIFIKIIKNYKIELILLIILSIIYSIFNILSMYNIKILINKTDLNILNKVLYIIILFQLIKNTTSYIKNKIINYINYHLSNKLFMSIYNHIIRLPYLYYKNHMTGDILTRINDIVNIKELISKIFVSIIIDSIILIIMFITLFKINANQSTIVLLMSILYIITIIIFNPIIYKKIKKLYINNANVNSYIVESINSIDTIKGLMVEEYITNNMSYKYLSLNNISYKLYNILYKREYLLNIIISIFNLLVIYLNIKNNYLSLENLLTYINLLTYLIEPLSNISEIHMTILNSKESINRIKDLIMLKKEDIKYLKSKEINLINNNLSIKNLSYSYDSSNYILKSLNIEIKNNSKVLLIGESGKGKSTLIKILSGYLKDYNGTILLNNINLKNFTDYELRNKICLISQSESLFTDSIYNNIVLNKKIDYNHFLNICKNLYIDKIVDKNILGYDMLLENNASNISGGEKSRIILARSLINKPNANIYIIDEQLSSLNINLERNILKYLFEVLKDKTVIVISHRLNNKDLFDNIIEIGNI